MTTLLEKVSTLISANLHALVDQALKTNSLAVVDQYLRQVDDNLASLEDAAATVGAEVRSVQRKLDEHQRRAATIDQAIDGFLAQGKEPAAAAAQDRLNSTRQLIQAYQQQLERHQAEYQGLLDARLKLQGRQAAMQAQRDELQSLLDLARSKEGSCIERINIRSYVPKVDGILCGALSFHGPNANGIAHSCIRQKRPIDTSSNCVERIDSSGVDADEDAAGRNCRLSVDCLGAGKSKSPFQF